MAKVVDDIIQQLAAGNKQVDVSLLMKIYEQSESNAQFLTEYIKALKISTETYFYSIGKEDRVKGLQAVFEKAQSILLDAQNNKYIIQVVIENDHDQTRRKLATSKPEDLTKVSDFIVWLNAPKAQ